MLGQAKVCLRVDSEEEMLTLAEKAAEHGLVNYVVVGYRVESGQVDCVTDTLFLSCMGAAD